MTMWLLLSLLSLSSWILFLSVIFENWQEPPLTSPWANQEQLERQQECNINGHQLLNYALSVGACLDHSSLYL